MRPDTSKAVREKVKGLLALKQSYKADNKKAVIRHDKLSIPDGVYTFDLDTQRVEKLQKRPMVRDTRHFSRNSNGDGNNDAVSNGDDDDRGPWPRGASQQNLPAAGVNVVPRTAYAYAGRGAQSGFTTSAPPPLRGFGRGRRITLGMPHMLVQRRSAVAGDQQNDATSSLRGNP
jgi:hypothetical protein